MPTTPEGPVKQHRNFDNTKTYVTLTSLRQFCRAARRSVCFGRRSRSRPPSFGVTLHAALFAYVVIRLTAATAAKRISLL